MADRSVRGARELPARVFLGSGRRPATWILILRCARAASWTLLASGIVIAVGVGQLESDDIADLNSVDGIVASFATPLSVFVAGLVLRFLVAPTAWFVGLGTVLSIPVRLVPTHERRRRLDRWRDVYRTAAYVRTLGWTIAVKHEAVDRLGRTGRVLTRAEAVLHTLTVLAVLALPVVSLTILG